MPIILTILAALSRLFASRIAMWVASVLVFFGLQFGSQTVLMQPLIEQIQASGAGFPAQAAQWVAFFNIDKAITIILSAYVVRGSMSAARVFLKRRGA